MNIPEIRLFRTPRNKDQILRFTGIPADKTVEESSLALLEECLSSLSKEAEGSIVFLRVPITWPSDAPSSGPSLQEDAQDRSDPSDQPVFYIADIPVASASLKKHLEGCQECLVLAATAGLTYDRLIHKNARLSPAKALWYQAIGASAIECILDAFCGEMEQKTGPMTSRFSPGYGDLPLTMQKDIFALLKPEKAIGLTLNDSLLMTPTKSVTAIIGIQVQKT